MPTISRFFGIIIEMRRKMKEHNPPHVHASYNEYTAEIDLKTGEIIKGNLNLKEKNRVKKWIDIHTEELERMWNTQEFYYVEPLK